jgi:hypothetical protein
MYIKKEIYGVYIMKKGWKSSISFLCAMAMMVGMTPEFALADEISDTQEGQAITSETETSEAFGESKEIQDTEERQESADAEPQISEATNSVSVEENNKITVTADKTQRYFTVDVRNVTVTDIKNMTVAVWSKNNGQDDLKWYPAKHQEDDSWTVTVDMKNHKSDTGMYYAHVYVDTNDGKSRILGAETFDVEGMHKGTLTSTVKSKDDGIYRIELNGDLSPAGVSKVMIPIWSAKNGQDDLVWYEAKKSNNTWYVDLDISKHKYDTGSYYAHAYVTDNRGIEVLLNTLTFSVSDMKKNVVSAQMNASQTEATVTLKNFTGSADSVVFPVWGKTNGQNDLYWYPATKIDSHTYTATVKIANHKETGTYAAHAYYSKNGKSTFVGATTFNVDGIKTAELSVVHQNEGKGVFDVSVSNIQSASALKNVSVAVWSNANGQDDLKWYEASKKDGSWNVHVDVLNHKMNTGSYSVHVYATDERGIFQFVKSTIVNVSSVTVKPTVKAVVDENAGTAQITVSDILNASRVQVPVWGSSNGQNDLCWYEATKRDARTWTATVELGNHMETGTYNVHVYTTTGGKMSFACNTTFNVSKITSNIISVYNKNDDMGTFSAKIQNVSNKSKLKVVRVAVWSAKNGQDDLVWQDAKQNGNVWYTDVDCVDHMFDSGTYAVHFYGEYTDGQFKFLRGTTTEVKLSGKYGFVKSGSKVYYYERPGVMSKGLKEINGYTYYFNKKNGVMATGWTYLNGYKYYFDSNGRRVEDLTNILGNQSSYSLKVNKQMNVATMYTYDAATGSYCIPVKSMRCATGQPTPLGTYNLSQTYRWLLMYNGTYCQYCTLITGDYLLHSIVYFKRGDIYSMQSEGYNGLAMRVGQSAGCVRFQCGNAYWIYNLVNAGKLRQVTIYNSSDYGPYGLPYVAPIPGSQTWDPTDPLI